MPNSLTQKSTANSRVLTQAVSKAWKSHHHGWDWVWRRWPKRSPWELNHFCSRHEVDLDVIRHITLPHTWPRHKMAAPLFIYKFDPLFWFCCPSRHFENQLSKAQNGHDIDVQGIIIIISICFETSWCMPKWKEFCLVETLFSKHVDQRSSSGQEILWIISSRISGRVQITSPRHSRSFMSSNKYLCPSSKNRHRHQQFGLFWMKHHLEEENMFELENWD